MCGVYYRQCWCFQIIRINRFIKSRWISIRREYNLLDLHKYFSIRVRIITIVKRMPKINTISYINSYWLKHLTGILIQFRKIIWAIFKTRFWVKNWKFLSKPLLTWGCLSIYIWSNIFNNRGTPFFLPTKDLCNNFFFSFSSLPKLCLLLQIPESTLYYFWRPIKRKLKVLLCLKLYTGKLKLFQNKHFMFSS